MSDIDPLLGPIIFVVYPDAETANYIEAVILSTGQSYQVIKLTTLTELYQKLPEVPDTASVITDLMWEESDASDVLMSMALKYPRIGFLALTNYDVTDILPPFFPIPCVQGIEDINAWFNILYCMLEDLRGSNISNFQLKDFVAQSQQARIYSAHQSTIRRDVQLLVLPLNSSEESKMAFRKIASAQAGNIHPVIYAIYEEGEDQGRPYVAQEPVNSPSMLQLSLQNTKLESRSLARIINTVATAIKHHQSHNIPYQPLRSSHITLSSQGVTKIINTALPLGVEMPNEQEQLSSLAQIIRDFTSPTEGLHTSLSNLLIGMDNFNVTAEEAAARSNAIDIELAPVTFTPVRQEAVIAQAQVKKAQKNFWIATISGIAVFALLVTALVSVMLDSYVLVPPGKDFDTQLEIPMGDVVLGEKVFTVQKFYIDQHEVTIGQYKKFLEATKNQAPETLLPENLPINKKNFIPKEWNIMIEAINKKNDYLGGPLTYDSPICNVDYADALAYAKWAGKRLPTELEWIRAASGNTNSTYPWGKDADYSKANTGYDRNKNALVKEGGSVDGFRSSNPVDEKSSDISPFNVYGMAGNVSEWVDISKDLGPFRQDFRPFKGSNHGIDKLVPNQVRTGGAITTQNGYLGFRCASDKLIK